MGAVVPEPVVLGPGVLVLGLLVLGLLVSGLPAADLAGFAGCPCAGEWCTERLIGLVTAPPLNWLEPPVGEDVDAAPPPVETAEESECRDVRPVCAVEWGGVLVRVE